MTGLTPTYWIRAFKAEPRSVPAGPPRVPGWSTGLEAGVGALVEVQALTGARGSVPRSAMPRLGKGRGLRASPAPSACRSPLTPSHQVWKEAGECLAPATTPTHPFPGPASGSDLLTLTRCDPRAAHLLCASFSHL